MSNTVKWIIAIVVALVIVWVVLSIERNATQRPPQSELIKIGAILPLTGWGAYWGEPEKRGIDLAKNEITAGGGRVEVLVEDGGTDPAKSTSAAQKLINVDMVQGFFTEFTGPASAVAPLSAQYMVPLIYDAVTKKPLEASQYALKAYFDMDKQCFVAAQALVKEGKKKIGTLVLNLDFNSECKSAVARALAGTDAKEFDYDIKNDTVDFRTIIVKMKADGVDGLVPVFYEDNAVAFFRQIGDLRFKPAIFMGIGVPDGFTDKVRSSATTEVLEGVRTYDQKINPSFRNKVLQKYPGIEDKDILAAAYGYDETMYLYRAIAACGAKRDATCATAKILADTSYQGALDAVHFGPDRILNLTPYYFVYKSGKLEGFSPTTD